jgi:hypothetical protein
VSGRPISSRTTRGFASFSIAVSRLVAASTTFTSGTLLSMSVMHSQTRRLSSMIATAIMPSLPEELGCWRETGSAAPRRVLSLRLALRITVRMGRTHGHATCAEKFSRLARPACMLPITAVIWAMGFTPTGVGSFATRL